MCQLFADDAKIFKSVRSTDHNKNLQGDLDSLTEWSTRWQLPFNVKKCKSLHIGRNNRKHMYEMDGKELDQVKEEKDLGVLIDNELKFHKQTAAAIKRASSVSLYSMSRPYLFSINRLLYSMSRPYLFSINR